MARTFRHLLLVASTALAGASLPAHSHQDSDHVHLESTTLAEGLVHPWGMAFLPNGDLVVTERAGGIRVLKKDGTLTPRLSNVPEVAAVNQGGMLDITLDPDFEDNNTLYFCFSQPGEGGSSSSVARATYADNGLSDVSVIFSAAPLIDNGFHFGCRLTFDNEGKLFVTLGDRYKYMDEAQNTNNHFGTIVRINSDGTVPTDNPFTEGDAPEVFSYGHRNVQGVTVHPQTGKVWAMEHGPKGGDEVNLINKGANYGWPVITYGIDYSGEVISDKTHKEGMAQPWLYWDPSIAPSGMAFYTGDMFPEWEGDLLVGSLKFTHLRRVEVNNGQPADQHEYLRDNGERIRDVEIAPDGAIYLLTDAPNGKVIKLTRAK
ncbi:MAG TPA: PQQ-dependent sugar dehydrogenase [Alteromonas australica]|jgi:aldose sugar dehydrogenase|uniref:PQQ-dependent sugar dehydrogenase n=1 Tax=Alteromonas australica TaxID=589873 RepID=A0A358DZI7_9ALTE|nr:MULTISPECIES: PQQ-dependent sugar dehydrogenase [Alteromonas]MAB92280.1 glucose dehydrogenase [Alteromonas sp.]MAO30085.1 glucose dehydrogenase [Alteromonas sp.]MBU33212.1 glucose dehydrogenase [Alteromonas sp.]QPL49613.1 PQQ-dependent sugar dehydrogenase [Alteromonas sp. B31-7]HAI73749.1 PQQ-dependent sugar dehydrogenase [Alteromonas australica]|tara:strand:+ start:1318 stop:2439 length:1122 start_codon:yes stop_codon:yes gene_type:complete